MNKALVTCVMTTAVLAALLGCTQEEPPEALSLQISEAQLDTVRAWMKRYGVTREEYWDDRGGVVANEHFEVWYPAGTHKISSGMFTLRFLMEGRSRLIELAGSAPSAKLKVICTSSLDDYKERTKNEWWEYASVEKERVIVQPVYVLFQRNLGEVAIPKVYLRWAISEMTAGEAPQWVRCGLAGVLSGERRIADSHLGEHREFPVRMKVKDIESALKKQNDKREFRFANYNSIRMMEKLIADTGRPAVSSLLRAMADGQKRDQAFQSAIGKSYDETVKMAMTFNLDEEGAPE